MKLAKWFLLLTASGFLTQALASDLENILAGGAATSGKGGPAEQNTLKKSPLVITLQKEIGAANAEQSLFLRFIETNDWDKAALQFPRAFEGTAFQKSANGR